MEPGADSSVPVTSLVNGQTLVALAVAHYGRAPVFWGRYFSPGNSWAEYRHKSENAILRANNIRVLPIAQQTGKVNGSYADGATDAESNVDDLIATFGQDYLSNYASDIYMFLDVEGAPNPILTASYYEGWSNTLVAHSRRNLNGRQVLPCVYGVLSDAATWNAVRDEVNSGRAPFFGAWVAAWPTSGCVPLPQNWDARHTAIPLPNGKYVLAWQYSNDCNGPNGFDCSVTNPNIDLNADLVSHLILPPG